MVSLTVILRAHGLQYLNLDSIEVDDVNEAEEDLPVEGGGGASGTRGGGGGEERGRKKAKVTLWFRISGDSRTA